MAHSRQDWLPWAAFSEKRSISLGSYPTSRTAASILNQTFPRIKLNDKFTLN